MRRSEGAGGKFEYYTHTRKPKTNFLAMLRNLRSHSVFKNSWSMITTLLITEWKVLAEIWNTMHIHRNTEPVFWPGYCCDNVPSRLSGKDKRMDSPILPLHRITFLQARSKLLIDGFRLRRFGLVSPSTSWYYRTNTRPNYARGPAKPWALYEYV